MGRPRVRSAARPALSLGPFAALTPSRAPDRAPRQPWSAEEHSRFLDALDRTENGDSAGIWQSIARSVGARPVHEVKLHAHKYLLHLHAAGAGQGAAARDPALQRPWAREEDEAFENALAEVGEGAGLPASSRPRPAAARYGPESGPAPRQCVVRWLMHPLRPMSSPCHSLRQTCRTGGSRSPPVCPAARPMRRGPGTRSSSWTWRASRPGRFPWRRRQRPGMSA